jgi:hypothetical protein
VTLTIRCDYGGPDFKLCKEELSGMAFNAKPASWVVVDKGHGDHRDYCPEHAALRGLGGAMPDPTLRGVIGEGETWKR